MSISKGVYPLVLAISSVLLFPEIGVAQPNLAPYQVTGWSDRIVVSKVMGANTDSSGLLTTDTLYVDWAVTNNGMASTAVRFYTDLYVDGVLRNTWHTDPPFDTNYFVTTWIFPSGHLPPVHTRFASSRTPLLRLRKATSLITNTPRLSL
jgi:hypothetical protein